MALFDKKPNVSSNAPSASSNPSVPGNNPFAAIAAAKASRGGVYVAPGVYPLLCVDTLKVVQNRKGDTIFIAELEILESDVAERPVGSRMTWAPNARHDPTPGNIKQFLTALYGCDESEVDEQSAAAAYSADNPCRGRLVRCEAAASITKSGNDFTRCTWVNIPEDVQEKAQELRNKAGLR